ncbi:type VI secretion system ATPase TssH [Hydromonas duriensis]|uniref:Type VI secretion system protein VasG n=1 Tax=Hydromonas duriensis TaxID=1527608 RepID=A0A4R6Y9I5_9BURK|nr:type VI secretion system ATPase TssH [Hydromonas duriensis]TDR32121.1 type VI secretion system protein VasG [Hydromonas duriensis]
MDISRSALFGKLNPTLFKSVEGATVFCKLRGNPYVELVHWLQQIVQLPDSDIHRIARHYQFDMPVLERDITSALMALPNGASSISDFSHHITEAIERAWVYSTLYFESSSIRSAYLLAVLLKIPEFRTVLFGISTQFRKIPTDEIEHLPALSSGSPEGEEHSYDGSQFDSSVPGEASNALPSEQKNKSGLQRFCTDLTEQARQGKIDPVIGRSGEIRGMIDILLRRRQNNPLLTGEAGVGKTAVVEGLALAIASGDVPPVLQNVKLLSLDVGALLAGASMKGEFESRLKGVIEDVGKSKEPVILFIDEVHTLVGAGGAQGTGDAANLLKPALARGALRTVGATTWSEYKKHIEKDPALTRRFQVLQVMEPEEVNAINMVRGLVDVFTKHHKVGMLDEAIVSAVRLSHRYIPSRQLPDKAISLLDTACARVAFSLNAPPAQVESLRMKLASLKLERDLLQKEINAGGAQHERLVVVDNELKTNTEELSVLEARWQQEKEVVEELRAAREQVLKLSEEDSAEGAHLTDLQTQIKAIEEKLKSIQVGMPLVYERVGIEVVASIVSDWTGIPVGKMMKDEMVNVLSLDNDLQKRVIGQNHALDQIANRVQTSYAQLLDPDKPIGVFMLVGTSGIGKTETALALADVLYGGEQNLITINMSEYQEAHTISTLKGAPPGYVGYGEGGVLTEAVRRRPYSVILLDEIEKAHSDVHEIFYQVFDKGWMEDGEGRYIDFKNTTILLTSNAGSDVLANLCQDETLLPEPEALREAIFPELLKVFPAAFLGRVTIVPYYPLKLDDLAQIVRIQMNKIKNRFALNHNVDLAYSDKLVQHIVDSCLSTDTGARLVIGFIEKNILPKLGRLWLESFSSKKIINKLEVSVEDGNIVIC